MHGVKLGRLRRRRKMDQRRWSLLLTEVGHAKVDSPIQLCHEFGCKKREYKTTQLLYVCRGPGRWTFSAQLHELLERQIRHGAGDYGTVYSKQKKSYKWRYIKQDDEGKQQPFKLDTLVAADTNKVAVNEEWLGRVGEKVRHEGRIATKDQFRKSEAMRKIWNRNASKATFVWWNLQLEQYDFDAIADVLISIVKHVE